MMQEYTTKQFENDKREMLEWLEKNWTYHEIEIGNLLQAVRRLIDKS